MGNTSNNMQYADKIHCIGPTTDCSADVIFVVDESGSVKKKNFELMKTFLSQLVGRLDIDSGNTRVGLVTYSNNVDTAEAFNLNAHSSVASVQSAISSLTYSPPGTRTDRALNYVRTVMLTSEAGDRHNVFNVVVVLTDGKSSKSHKTKVGTLYTMWKLMKETSLFQKLS